MKKFLAICLIAAGVLTAAAKEIKEYVVTTTPPMSCQNCENRIKGNLRFEKGVKNVETDLKNQRVVVTYDAEKTDETKLQEAFKKINYKVEKVSGCKHSASEKKECAKGSDCCSGKESAKEKKEDCCKDATGNVAIGYSEKKSSPKKK